MPYDFTTDTRPRVHLSDILIPPDRQRKVYNGIMELAKDIEEKGLIQPVVLTKVGTDAGKFRLVAGGRRTRAFATVPGTGGLIPYSLREEMTTIQQKEWELSENLFREDISWEERIAALEELDTLKKSLLGTARTDSPTDPGWSLKKTADVAGISKGVASEQIKFAKKLKERPDIRARVKNLPMTAAMRVADHIEEAERTQRLHDTGQIELTTELKNLDALSFLKLQKDNSVHLFLIDPPFGMEELDGREGEDSKGATTNFTTQMKPSDNLTEESALALLEAVAPEMYRVLSNGCHGYMFFELELLGELKTILRRAGFTVNFPVLLWDKQRTTTIFRGYNYTSCYEAILYFHKGKEPRRLSESMQSIIRCPAVHASKKTHVFEKPIDLLARLIKQSTNVADVVCDLFAGSGSTLVAAKQTARGALGCELDPEHFIKAQARLLLEQH
jgi:site-specific DNA-methyltransferase (adenine-specific)